MTALLQTSGAGTGLELRLAGGWCIDNVAAMEKALQLFRALDARQIRVRYGGIERLDLSGA